MTYTSKQSPKDTPHLRVRSSKAFSIALRLFKLSRVNYKISGYCPRLLFSLQPCRNIIDLCGPSGHRTVSHLAKICTQRGQGQPLL